MHVWVFGLDIPGNPPNAWDVIKQYLDPGADLSKYGDAVFPPLERCGFFVVPTTLYAIWIERLRRMQDLSLSQELHTTTTSATTISRRSVRKFSGSTYPTDMGEDGQLFAQVRWALTDILICYDDPPSLQVRPI